MPIRVLKSSWIYLEVYLLLSLTFLIMRKKVPSTTSENWILFIIKSLKKSSLSVQFFVSIFSLLPSKTNFVFIEPFSYSCSIILASHLLGFWNHFLSVTTNGFIHEQTWMKESDSDKQSPLLLVWACAYSAQIECCALLSINQSWINGSSCPY